MMTPLGDAQYFADKISAGLLEKFSLPVIGFSDQYSLWLHDYLPN
jgi:hypothetical protein